MVVYISDKWKGPWVQCFLVKHHQKDGGKQDTQKIGLFDKEQGECE